MRPRSSAAVAAGTLACALMAISVGFGMALAISNPLLINLIRAGLGVGLIIDLTRPAEVTFASARTVRRRPR